MNELNLTDKELEITEDIVNFTITNDHLSSIKYEKIELIYSLENGIYQWVNPKRHQDSYNGKMGMERNS